MAKRWTDEEIQFLKFAYPNKDFTPSEIAKELSRSYQSICSKARNLGLNVYEENLPKGFKRCCRCHVVFPVNLFYTDKSTKDGYCCRCKECDKERMIKTRSIREKESIREKKCLKCKNVKPVNEFTKRLRNKDGLDSYCKECNKIAKEKSKLKLLKERGW